jgi:hypothetical protein
VKGDARSEAPSSEAGIFQRLLSACDRYAGLGFAGFVVVHFAYQAMRAHGDAAVPEAGLEAEPAIVAGLLLVIGLPFAVFAWRRLWRGIETRSAHVSEKARALAVLEYCTLCVVLAFLALHGSQIVWPLLSGAFDRNDVRPELIALLSSTTHGARQTLRAEGAARVHTPTVARGRVIAGLFVVVWALGSYAVIRCASGVILP